MRWVIATLVLLSSTLATSSPVAASGDYVGIDERSVTPSVDGVYPGADAGTVLTSYTVWGEGRSFVRVDVSGSAGSPVEVPGGGRVRGAVADGAGAWRIGVDWGTADGLYRFAAGVFTLLVDGSVAPVSAGHPDVAGRRGSSFSSAVELVEVDDAGNVTELGITAFGEAVPWEGGAAFISWSKIEFVRLDGSAERSSVEANFPNPTGLSMGGGVLTAVYRDLFALEIAPALVTPAGVTIIDVPGPGRFLPVDDESFLVIGAEAPIWRVWLDGHVETMWFDPAVDMRAFSPVAATAVGQRATIIGADRELSFWLPQRQEPSAPQPAVVTDRSPASTAVGDIDGRVVEFTMNLPAATAAAAWSPDLRYVLTVDSGVHAYVSDTQAGTFIGPITPPAGVGHAAWDPLTRSFMTTARSTSRVPWVSYIGLDGSVETIVSESGEGRGADVNGGHNLVVPNGRRGDLLVTRHTAAAIGLVDQHATIPSPGGVVSAAVTDPIRRVHLFAGAESTAMHLALIDSALDVVSDARVPLLPGGELGGANVSIGIDEISGIGVVAWVEKANNTNYDRWTHRIAIVDLDDGSVQVTELGVSTYPMVEIHVVIGDGAFDIVTIFHESGATPIVSVVRGLSDGSIEFVDGQVSFNFAFVSDSVIAGRGPQGELLIVESRAATLESRGVALLRSPSRRSAVGSGYWLVTEGGDLYPFGDAPFTRSSLGPVVDSAAHSAGAGLWAVRADGSVVQAGGASWFGDADLAAGESAVAIAPTPTNMGYWVFTDTGRVMAFGDAEHLGDLSGIRLDGSVIAALATTTGRGYYLVASDGGVFAFGDAPFLGSVPQILPGVSLAAPIVGISPTEDGRGYWLVASDGGVFSFDAPFRGSIPAILPGRRLDAPVNGMVPYGNGYLLVASDGGVFNFSDLAFEGSLGGQQLGSPVTAIAQFS